MAVKIVRQANRIALIGAPTSAAGLQAGHERAPGVLRGAGLVERLRAAGYEVADLGDCSTQLYQPDDDHPRARNLPAVLAALNDLKPRIEQAVKAGALPLVLGGDCIIALATLAGIRRYYRNVSLVYFDRDADLNVPATTPSGCVDGMVVAHIVGRGAPELVRFWGEPPLVREPDVALFGTERLDPPEEAQLARSPIRRYLAADVQRQGPAAAAEAALERIHAASHEFLLHFDVDAISSDDFRATNFPAPGGLNLNQVRQALEVFARQKNLAAVEVTAYNPELDPDGSAAGLLVELLAGMLAARLAALASVEASAAASVTAVAAPPAETEAPVTSMVVAPEASGAAAVAGSPTPEVSPATPAVDTLALGISAAVPLANAAAPEAPTAGPAAGTAVRESPNAGAEPALPAANETPTAGATAPAAVVEPATEQPGETTSAETASQEGLPEANESTSPGREPAPAERTEAPAEPKASVS